MKSINSLLIVLILVLSVSTLASEGRSSYSTQSPEVSNRQANKLGAYASLFGDPAPVLFGINGAYNINDFLRLHAGFGQVKVTTSASFNGTSISTSDSSMTTIGAGVLGMVPGWSLTPVAGLSYSRVFVSGDGNFNVSTNNIYGTVGGDWQAANGFNIGVGVNFAVSSNTASGAYVNVGWFFM